MTSLAAVSPVLVFVTLLAACVWVGGFVAIVVVARVARSRLEPAVRVAFFRALGRSYGIVGNVALVVMLAGGAALLADRGWDATAAWTVAVAAAVVLATVAGVIQARGMTRLRRAALEAPDDAALAARVRRGAGRAAALRATIGVLSVALLALASVLAT